MARLSPIEARQALSVGSGKGRIREVAQPASSADQNGAEAEVSETRLAEERAFWVSERQGELAKVLDRHDDLVREVFHLEKFVTMVSFDPKAAKADKSSVFQEYKTRYDLLEKMSDTTGSPTRKTRSAHTERLQHLNVTSPSGGTGKGKPEPSHSNAVIWDIIYSAKAKSGKRRHDAGPTNGAHDCDTADENMLISPTSAKTKGKPILGSRLDTSFRSSDHSPTSQMKRARTETDISDVSPPPHKKRKTNQPPIPGGIKRPRFYYNALTSKLSGNGLDADSTSQLVGKDQHPAPSSRTSARRASQSQPHAEFQRQDLPTFTGSETVNATVPLTPSSTIKRIKLIVRQPPPMFTNPRQRPPRPIHGSSLKSFLSSYHTLDERDVTEDAMSQTAENEAGLRERIHTLQREGRMRPDGDPLSLAGTNLEAKPIYKRGPDAWDHVIHAVLAQNRSKRNKGRHIASQITSKIQAYWDGYAARKDKARLQEEKRLRVLAKSTIKMVTNEWKKAVFHIREKERQRLEAEERRLGHEHLDAILDQSGQILETQQGDLVKGDPSRSRSRSSSASLFQRDWTPEESDEDSSPGTEGDDEEENIDEAGEETKGSIQEDDESEPGTHALLADMSVDPDESGTLLDNRMSEEMEFDHDDQDNDSTLAIDELIATSSVDSRPSSPTTSLFLPQSPLHESSTIASVDMPFTQSSEPTLTDPEITANGLWKEIEGSNSLDVVNGLDEISRKEDNDDFEPPSSDIQWSIELLEAPSSPIQPDHSPETEDRGTLKTPHDDLGISQATEFVDDVKVSPSADHDIDTIPEDIVDEQRPDDELTIPEYLRPYAVAPIEWDLESKVRPPLLLRGILRPYQQSGLEWLASLHMNNLNGILADEMGLGKTIQAISLLAHLACDRGIWGPHLIIVPTSVLLNWEMEFKKFLPGFKILSYHGSTKRRKELRQGWNDKQHFNVCITSYTLASRDAHIFKRKAWYYMILDEAHMIKNFKSQRWNILLMFRSFRRLLLTGTPLQNNLTELWALLQFLMSGANFANLKEFGDWFSSPLEKAIEMGTVNDDETQQRVSKLHTVLRPYLLRRLKRDVEKELPSKFEHLVLCPLSKRQRFLYDEFMSRAQTQEALQSGVYQKVANILMQLRKVCNHPDLFEIRPIVTSFTMERSAIADFEIKELLIRRRMLKAEEDMVNLDILGLRFVELQETSLIAALESRRLDATPRLPLITEMAGEPPLKDTRTITGFRRYMVHQLAAETASRWSHIGYLNNLRCKRLPIYSEELIATVKQLQRPLLPTSVSYPRTQYLSHLDITDSLIKSYPDRAREMATVIDKFAFITPPVVARDLPRIVFRGYEALVSNIAYDVDFSAVLHAASAKLQIAFPDPSLLQYDCGKLQELTILLREKKAGGHRVLIFTQMTRILDILETFLNFHGYLYLRLDGATKIEDRQYITERFNADSRIFCFIASSRSGGVGINLTGADTVVFYDSDFNPQMDRQCEDRAHRIGQIRDVHIYRFISQHTVEEAMLRKANQKRSLDDLVIQKGEFDWRSLFGDETALTKALGEFEDKEDAHAAAVAAREEYALVGADEAEFGGDADAEGSAVNEPQPVTTTSGPSAGDAEDVEDVMATAGEGGDNVVDYMLSFVERDYDFFRDWRL